MIQRVLTGIALVAVVLLSFSILTFDVLRWVALPIMALVLWEWWGLRTMAWWWRVVLCFLPLILLALQILGYGMAAPILALLGSLVWAGAGLLMVTGRVARTMAATPRWTHDIFVVATVGIAMALMAEMSLLSQQANGLLLGTMAVVWLADSGAYFAGRRYGRHLLAAALSPKKTWEGLWGGWVAAVLFALVWIGVAPDTLGSVSPMTFLLAAALAAPVSVLGDLVESGFKRHYQVKDSGGLLPGHGGVYDRVDGLVAAIPLQWGLYVWLS